MKQKSFDGTHTLYLISTPIGNMEDITYRAIRILKEVNVIFSEDTRITMQLLNYYGIKNKLISSHQYNEKENTNKLLSYLEKGDVGLVTDRGTPIISDPGYILAQTAINNNYNVVAVPGASALLCALITSNIDPQPFTFIGFLNSKSSKRKTELEQLKYIKHALIFYESPHRLLDTLKDMKEILGNRKIAISREISKKFEEIYRGTIDSVSTELEPLKGEFVLVVDGDRTHDELNNLSILENVDLYIKMGLSSKDAIKKVAHERKLNKNEVYSKYHNRSDEDEIDSWFGK